MRREFVFPLHVRVQFGTEHGEWEHDPEGGQEWSGIGVQHCHSLHHLFYGHLEEEINIWKSRDVKVGEKSGNGNYF